MTDLGGLFDEARQRIDAEHEGDYAQRKPRVFDEHPARATSVYLRADVVDWLRAEALRRGNGYSASRLINELVRQEMKEAPVGSEDI